MIRDLKSLSDVEKKKLKSKSQKTFPLDSDEAGPDIALDRCKPAESSVFNWR